VVVSLLGLLLIGLSFTTGLGIGAALIASFVVTSSLALLPAVLDMVQERVNITRRAGMAGAVLMALGLLALGLGQGPVFLGVGAALAIVILLAAYLPFVCPPSPLPLVSTPRWPEPLQPTSTSPASWAAEPCCASVWFCY